MQSMANKTRAAAALIGAVLLVAIVGGWYLMSGRNNTAAPEDQISSVDTKEPVDAEAANPATPAITDPNSTDAKTKTVDPTSAETAQLGPTGEPVPAAYTVLTGDNLSKISVHFYGTDKYMGDIENLNKDVLNGDADKLAVGMVLKLPKPDTLPTIKTESQTQTQSQSQTQTQPESQSQTQSPTQTQSQSQTQTQPKTQQP